MDREKKNHLIESNSLETLAALLHSQLFDAGASPFAKRLVIVPSLEIKRFLTEQWIEKKALVMGVQMLTPDAACAHLFTASGMTRSPKILGRAELFLLIQEELIKHYKESNFSPIQEYILEDGEISFCKVASISDKIALIFLEYGIYSHESLEAWLKKEGWQQSLWKYIYADSRFSYPILELQKKASYPETIALFHCAHLSPIYHHFFSQFNHYHYAFSPSNHYWGDLFTEREALALELRLAKIKKEHKQSYLEVENRLLGNWGKLLREQRDLLIDYSTESEDYFLKSSGRSALAILQNDLLELAPQAGKVANPERDLSIQLHATPSLLREVEVLYDVVVTGEIPISQIVVYAPDIDQYAPYIKMVFGGSEISYQIQGLRTTDDLIAGIKLFLGLPEERFEVTYFIRLLSNPLFMKVHQISESQLRTFQKLLEMGNISWGINLSHKKQILKTDEMLLESGTWDDGIRRLLWGLAISEQGCEEDLPLPVAGVEMSNAESLGLLIALYRQVKKDFLPILENHLLSAQGWSVWFKELVCSHFGKEALESKLFSNFKWSLPEESKVPFSSFAHLLDLLFNQKESAHSAYGLSFRSFTPGNIHPAKMIWLLGADESTLPRSKSISPLCEMSNKPSIGDQDRSLFLELLSHAREMLIFSYLYLSAQDGKEQMPSRLIQELLSTISERVENPPPTIKHSILPFDARYYKKESDFQSASLPYYEALLKRNLEKVGPPHFPFICPEEVKISSLNIEIKNLVKLMRDPLQFYCNEGLGLFLQRDEQMERKRGNLLLSPLEMHKLKQEALLHPVESVLARAKKRGTLPEGSFLKFTSERLLEEAESMRLIYSNFGIDEGSTFSATFSTRCLLPERAENGDWNLPAIQIKGLPPIIGSITHLTADGIIFHADSELKDHLRILPLLLVYHLSALPNEYKGKSVYLLKSGEKKRFICKNSEELLTDLIRYHDLCKEAISPLHPFLINDFFKESSRSPFAKKNLPYSDPYFEWVIESGALYPASEAYASWKKRDLSLFNCDLFDGVIG